MAKVLVRWSRPALPSGSPPCRPSGTASPNKGLSAAYYYSDYPFTVLFGSRFQAISHPIARFFDDARAGALANVTYIDPRLIGEEAGRSNDDHPLADIRNGQAFVGRIYDAVTSSPNWPERSWCSPTTNGAASSITCRRRWRR